MKLEPGEIELHRESASVPRKRAAVLILTDRRVVRLASGALEEIRREDFAGVEVVWDRNNESYLVLRSTGASYLHVALDVIVPEPAAAWRERLARWRNGEWERGAAPLPTAKIWKK